MSTSLILASSSFKPRTRSSASATVLFIFQLPAMISFRSLFMSMGSLVTQGSYARQHFSFEEFEACSAAGAHESDLVTELGFVDGFHAVPAADDAGRAAFTGDFGNRARDCVGAFGETLVLEQAHGPIPKNGLCLG